MQDHNIDPLRSKIDMVVSGGAIHVVVCVNGMS